MRANSVLYLTVFFLLSCVGRNQPGKAEEEILHILIDQWHQAAATADEDIFFGFMTVSCIYLGTDITEKWKRDELKEWSIKFFDRESAWAFTPFEREIYFSGNTAWFDEKLETWMGECRGSGVLVYIDGEWKLDHYHLSVTIPNEKIQGFISLVSEEK